MRRTGEIDQEDKNSWIHKLFSTATRDKSMINEVIFFNHPNLNLTQYHSITSVVFRWLSTDFPFHLEALHQNQCSTTVDVCFLYITFYILKHTLIFLLYPFFLPLESRRYSEHAPARKSYRLFSSWPVSQSNPQFIPRLTVAIYISPYTSDYNVVELHAYKKSQTFGELQQCACCVRAPLCVVCEDVYQFGSLDNSVINSVSFWSTILQNTAAH